MTIDFSPRAALVALVVAAAAGAQRPADTTRARRVLTDTALLAAVDRSAAQQPLRAPDLIGLDTLGAFRKLLVTDRRLTRFPRAVAVPRAPLVPVDSIVAQFPLPDSALRGGDTIRLVLGARTAVPRVIGRTRQEAERLLEIARLRGQAANAPAAADSEIGRVVRQAVDSGTLVPPGTAIGYDLGVDARFALPSVIGRTVAGARAILRDSGLTSDPGARSATGAGTPVDSVVAEEPPAGTLVWPTATVVLTVGLRPAAIDTTTAIDTAKATVVDTGRVTDTAGVPVIIRTPDSPPPPFPWIPIAITAAAALAAGTLAAHAAWLPHVTPRATLRPYPPRLAADATSPVAGAVGVRARLTSHPPRAAFTGRPFA